MEFLMVYCKYGYFFCNFVHYEITAEYDKIAWRTCGYLYASECSENLGIEEILKKITYEIYHFQYRII